MIVQEPFALIPLAILHDARLSPGARSLFGVLQSHARRRGVCFPSYARLRTLLGRCEDTVRKWMRELIAAGLVKQRRRGRGHTNIYTLVSPVTTGKNAIQEPDFFVSELNSFKTSSKDLREAQPFCDFSPSTEPASPMLPPDVSRLLADIGNEMRDVSPKSSRTRVARMVARTDNTADMYGAMIAARATTRRKLPHVRNRARNGQVRAMPFFLACLSRALGVTPAREIPAKPPVRLVAARCDEIANNAPPVIVPARDEARIQFWESVREACGISSQREFVSLCKRAAPFDDIAWAIRLCRDAQKRE